MAPGSTQNNSGQPGGGPSDGGAGSGGGVGRGGGGWHARPPPALAQDRYKGIGPKFIKHGSPVIYRCSTGGLTSWNGWIATLFNAPMIRDNSDERRRRPAAQPSV